MLFNNNNDFVFYCSYEHMTLNNLGECCNHVNIQSAGPALEVQWGSWGDYEKIGNDSNVYKNIMDTGRFLYTGSSGYWMVCTNY